MSSFVQIKGMSKHYKMGDNTIKAVENVSFEVSKGEFVVVVGPSGAGKTTLLNALGGMDKINQGEIIIDGEDISKYNAKQLTIYRRESVGFVFQFYNLVENLNALENVELATDIIKEAPKDAKETLESVGLGDRLTNFPSALSGGEQQRVAIARALAKNPKLLLCDEPTGALDYSTGKTILQLLKDSCEKTGTTVILITHNAAIAPMADRVIKLYNGEIRSIETNDNPTPVNDIEW